MTRKNAIKQLKMLKEHLKNDMYADDVNALNTAIQALEQEPKTDTWSIKEVADTLEKHGLMVEQDPKPGHWIVETVKWTKLSNNEFMYVNEARCSECNYSTHLATTEKDAYTKTNYCPNCGARMESKE